MSTGRKRRILSDRSAVQTVEVVTEGQVLCDRYELLREIARGGMGIVFEAIDRELEGSRVAIKVLPPELSTSEKYKVRLRKEAIAAMKLTHPGILRLHSFESDGDIVFLIMEFLTGPNLDQATIDPPKLPLDEVMDIARQVCPALDYAHKSGVIHRDIKPANLIFHDDGDERVVKITDFGIAFVVKDSISRVSGIESAGTLLYVSPEQLHGSKPGPYSDQYSLATTFYELISGETPFSGVGLSYQVINAIPSPLEGVPQHVNDAILRALSKDPEDRFPNCTEFLEAMEGKIPVIIPQKAPKEEKSEPSSSPLRYILFLVVFVGLLFGGYHWSKRKPRVLKDWRPTATPSIPLATKVIPTVKATKAILPTVAPTPVPPTPATPSLAVIATPKVTEPKIEPVKVTFSSLPPGAKVFHVGGEEDGTFVGKTDEPFEVSLMPGSYCFKFQLSGHHPETKEFIIPEGAKSQAPCRANLSEIKGTLSISLAIPDAVVTIDGKAVPADKLSALPIPLGKHTITATKEGFVKDEMVIDVADEQPIALTLRPKVRPKGPIQGEVYKNTIGMQFVWLPPATYKMGGRREDSPDEVPVHNVTIKDGFWIGKHEVTNGQFKLVSKVLPSRAHGDTRPVEKVSWFAAKAFCEQLTSLEQQKGELPTGYVYQLPSEAQWEYAARGGTNDRYGQINEMWCEDNSDGRTHDVGGRKANEYGLHDMLGNVWEWTLDYWHSSYRGAPTDGSAWLKGGDSSYRSLRGGSWDFPKRKCRFSIRLKDVPSRRQEDVGFRVVIIKGE